MADLKPGWKSLRFGEMVTSAGATRKARGWSARDAGVDRYVGLEHLDSNGLRIRRWGSPKDVGANSDLRPFEPGDVILARRGIELRKIGVAEFAGVASGHALVFRAKPDVVLPDYLPFLMQSDMFMNRADRFSVGSLSRTVNLSSLLAEEFILPPLEEQRRIAALLSAATSLKESLIDSVSAAETLLRSAVDAAAGRAVDRQSVLQLANLVEVERPICYGILMPGTGFEGGVPVVKVKDYPEGDIILEGLLRTDPKIDREYKRSRLRAGDLLISIRGTIGRLAIVPESLDGANITQDTARLSIRPEHDARYVRAMLESTFVQRQIVAFTTGLAVKGINIRELRRIEIPIVSPGEQQEVVKEVIAVRAAIREIEERLERSETLRKASLAEHVGGYG